MKAKHNIFIRFKESEYPFEGKAVIPYTGMLQYNVTEPPKDYDPETDMWIICPCDYKELGGFNKIEKDDNE